MSFFDLISATIAVWFTWYIIIPIVMVIGVLIVGAIVFVIKILRGEKIDF